MRPTTAVSSEENVEIPRNSSEDVDSPFRHPVRVSQKRNPLQRVLGFHILLLLPNRPRTQAPGRSRREENVEIPRNSSEAQIPALGLLK